MQISSTPVKWTIPFATNDSSKVEIPATTSDPTRFSLSLGSPPLTGQPPESGGVPPQLEDFNGAFNQISRFVWWAMGGGPLPFDPTWSADPNVNGYANGAMIPAADGLGDWISTADNNLINPDTVGTNWVPGYAYGKLSLTGQTGGTVTLTPAQAIKTAMSIAGTLTSNLTIIVPTWLRNWDVTNTTTGAFTVTVKTAAGAGVIIPQNSTPTAVGGDGTNVTQLPKNIAPATQLTHAVQLGQATGRLINTQIFTASGTYTPTAGTTKIRVRAVAGGGAGGGTQATSSIAAAAAGGGASGMYAEVGMANPGVQTVTIGAGGVAVSGGAGGAGGNTSFGALVVLIGGLGTSVGGAGTPPNVSPSAAAGTGGTVPGTGVINFNNGTSAAPGFSLSLTQVIGGGGGSNPFGSGQQRNQVSGAGVIGSGYGSGGSGAAAGASTAALAGGNGQPGILIVDEYA
jgi:hypothetical protein